MSGKIELSIGQQFEVERFSRAIDATADAEQLRVLAKQLLQAWQTQKAAATWLMLQRMEPTQLQFIPATSNHA